MQVIFFCFQPSKKVEYFCKTDKRLLLQRVFLNAKESKQTDVETEKQKQTDTPEEHKDRETEKEKQTDTPEEH
jgi:hypothetical protein